MSTPSCGPLETGLKNRRVSVTDYVAGGVLMQMWTARAPIEMGMRRIDRRARAWNVRVVSPARVRLPIGIISAAGIIAGIGQIAGVNAVTKLWLVATIGQIARSGPEAKRRRCVSAMRRAAAKKIRSFDAAGTRR